MAYSGAPAFSNEEVPLVHVEGDQAFSGAPAFSNEVLFLVHVAGGGALARRRGAFDLARRSPFQWPGFM